MRYQLSLPCIVSSQKNRMRKFMILKLSLATLVIYSSLLLILYVFQRHLIYFPDRTSSTPSTAGIPDMEIVEFPTSDGLSLKSWYAPPNHPAFPVLLYFHGNGGSIADRAFIAAHFLDQGFGFFLLSYRGYGGNPGLPTEEGLYEDARGALGFLETQGIMPGNVILMGESIGSAVAIKIAGEYPVQALILQGPFSSLVDVAMIHYAFFWPLKFGIQDVYNSVAAAVRVRCPTLLIHGLNDTIVPPELSRKLLDALPDPKEPHYLPGRGHNDIFAPEIIDPFLLRMSDRRDIDPPI